MKAIMLDAREVCNGVTGRNGGHIKSDFYDVFGNLMKRFSVEVARNIVRFQRMQMGNLRDVVGELERGEECLCNVGGGDYSFVFGR